MSARSQPQKNILICEDSRHDLPILKTILEKHGFKCFCFDSVDPALGKLEGEATIDVILSDIVMPGKTGVDFLGLVRESSQFSSLPFILITSSPFREHVDKAISLSVNGFLTKPVTEEKVVRELSKIFPEYEFQELANARDEYKVKV